MVKSVIDRGLGALRAMNSGRFDGEDQSSSRRQDVESRWSFAGMLEVLATAVLEFFGRLYEEARDEVQRLGMHERWMANYVLCRAKTQVATRIRDTLLGGQDAALSLGLISANIERTAANITAKKSGRIGQATTGDEETSSILSAMVDQWHNDEQQHQTLELAVKLRRPTAR